jgi:hypothetical protein
MYDLQRHKNVGEVVGEVLFNEKDTPKGVLFQPFFTAFVLDFRRLNYAVRRMTFCVATIAISRL